MIALYELGNPKILPKYKIPKNVLEFTFGQKSLDYPTHIKQASIYIILTIFKIF